MATQLNSIALEYALGYTAAEQERLIRQAERIAPVTERLFREAGIGPANVSSIWGPAWETSPCLWLASLVPQAR
jgi:hypothetical protein